MQTSEESESCRLHIILFSYTSRDEDEEINKGNKNKKTEHSKDYVRGRTSARRRDVAQYSSDTLRLLQVQQSEGLGEGTVSVMGGVGARRSVAPSRREKLETVVCVGCEGSALSFEATFFFFWLLKVQI